uniref:C-C motif chemokine n=1 Tax=Plecoglossus altivelis TaxID=61084 RepID=A0A678XER2_PLEAT|nr:monocyte chemoattractant protein 1b-like protein [Plecoglossus altivelis]
MTRSAFRCSTLLLALLIAMTTLGECSVMRCCTDYSKQPDRIQLARLLRYEIQDASGVCNMPAVIFRTVRGRQVCVDPESPWTKAAIKYLEQKRKAAFKASTSKKAKN